MTFARKFKTGLFALSLFMFITLPVMAFDLGKIIEKSIEKTIDNTVKKAENKVTNNIDSAISSLVPNLSPGAKPDDAQPKDLSKGVIIFGFNGCTHCRKAYTYLNNNNIRYELMDLEKDAKAQRLAKENSIRGVPVIYVSGERVGGFSDAKYDAIMKKHGVIPK